MDERFTLLIEQMESLQENAQAVQKDIKDTFTTVKSVQGEINTKLDSLNAQISDVIDQFKQDSESLQKILSDDVEVNVAAAKNAVSSAEDAVDKINKEYQSRVDTLVNEISGKSTEILTIYNELESIKIKKDEYSEFLKQAETEYHESLESLKAEFKKAMENSEFPKIVAQLEKLTPRIDRLEKHAHKHTFGGTKI